VTGISAIPNIPEKRISSAVIDSSVRIATPDLIQTGEEPFPIELITNLLFEQVGGQEIINIARNDIINGQSISYSLIGRIDTVQKLYNTSNMFKLSGTIKEFFANFAIRFSVHVPESGTGPSPYYVGEENSNGCSGFPVLGSYDDSVDGCFVTFAEAQKYIDETYLVRNIVYSDPLTGNIVVDVTRMEINERVDVEVQSRGILEDDTIY
jgi:hypothetical protein